MQDNRKPCRCRSRLFRSGISRKSPVMIKCLGETTKMKNRSTQATACAPDRRTIRRTDIIQTGTNHANLQFAEISAAIPKIRISSVRSVKHSIRIIDLLIIKPNNMVWYSHNFLLPCMSLKAIFISFLYYTGTNTCSY